MELNAPANMRRTAATGSGREMALFSDHDETVGLDDRDREARLRKELMLCAAVMETLQRFYPGFPWAVKFGGGGKDKETGRDYPAGIEIKIPVLMGTKSYVIPAKMLTRSLNESERLIRQAGGEILERFKIPRTPFRADAFVEARDLRKVLSYKTPMPE